jgi:cell wall-associated protease
MMNTIKTNVLASASFLLLVACSTSKNVLSSTGTAIQEPVTVQKKLRLKEADLNRWSHLDIINDTIPGMSVDRAYAELLKDKKGKKVVVAILDSGVDIEHEDLKSVIWTNKREIPGNGIDDDKNGFIDDVHGWNFLGDITKEHLEYERIIANKNLVDDATYQKAKAYKDDKNGDASGSIEQMKKIISDVTKAESVVAKHLGKTSYNLDDVNAIKSEDAEISKSKMILQRVNSYGMTVPEFKTRVQKDLDSEIEKISSDKPFENYRKVVGDNPEDITDNKYGNGNVMGPDKETTLHGTHVAGIVAQIRSNNLGGDGVASNVEILTVRAVPDGDEYDKDIALGIRYAVDNGAKIINGSFGKSFSPQKQWVYDAIKYAEKKDVLIVHAAGNDASDIDVADNYPNDSDDKINEFADNVLTIGALNYEYGKNIVATFSNFGKLNVDVFAPGVQIYATTPKNTYQMLQGTSMAAPNAAGVAAIIRSYFPKLSAKQVKHILMDSGVAITKDVVVGGDPQDVRSFATLSKSGKIVNAYNALLMAQKMSK